MKPCARVAIYARVSTDKQELANQLVELRAYAKHHGYQVVAEYTDIESGATSGRNGLSDALTAASRGKYRVLLCWAVDRLTRGGIEKVMRIYNWLRAQNVEVVSLQEPFLTTTEVNPARDVILAVMGWVAAYERGRISERTKSGLVRRKQLGHLLGRPKGSCDRRPRKRRLKRGTPGLAAQVLGGN